MLVEELIEKLQYLNPKFPVAYATHGDWKDLEYVDVEDVPAGFVRMDNYEADYSSDWKADPKHHPLTTIVELY
jgi:hypothetical protein